MKDLTFIKAQYYGNLIRIRKTLNMYLQFSFFFCLYSKLQSCLADVNLINQEKSNLPLIIEG
jgi:hypothetical protein